MSAGLPACRLELGAHEAAVAKRLGRWAREDVPSRLWARDFRLWGLETHREVADRMGWLDLPRTMAADVSTLEAVGREAEAEGLERVVLLGMGGSSLAPEVFQAVRGAPAERPRLVVLDSTHPGAVRRMAGSLHPAATLLVVSSKSGTTIETMSLFAAAWQWMAAAVGDPGRHFLAVTDPGTPLEALARERRFRAAFRADPTVGGRYSALSHFGLVPAALVGVEPRPLLEAASRMAAAAGPEVPSFDNPGLVLGAALGELAMAGRDKLTFLTTPGLDALPDWIEQLVAESTGKDGRGILPVVREPPRPAAAYRPDRVFVGLTLPEGEREGLGARLDELAAAGQPVVRIALAETSDLGAEMFRWELATAAAAIVLGVHPFDQPDVELAKSLARRAMEAAEGDTTGPSLPEVAVGDADILTAALNDFFFDSAGASYLAVQAFLAPQREVGRALGRLREKLGVRTRLAVTLGFGPRFLHSTGQLHKGGPDGGLFLQLLDSPRHDLPVPGTTYGFARLIGAQALGDAWALAERGRRVLRLQLGEDPAAGLERLLAVL